MIIESPAFENGKIADKYGAKGTDFGAAGMPALSFPLRISGAPPGTAAYAIVFDDPDSVPVCGFRWVHWLVVGLKPSLEEDASRKDPDIIQGANSWKDRGTDAKGASAYGGPSPPDRPHTYVLTAYALDFEPALRNGFELPLLEKISKGHILAKASVRGTYEPKQRTGLQSNASGRTLL